MKEYRKKKKYSKTLSQKLELMGVELDRFEIYKKEKILILEMTTKKNKFVKLIKFYLIDFTNEVERVGKPTEVSQARFLK